MSRKAIIAILSCLILSLGSLVACERQGTGTGTPTEQPGQPGQPGTAPGGAPAEPGQPGPGGGGG